MTHRDKEKDATHFRSERLIQINGQWFFTCRESDQPIGPFSSRAAAAHEIDRYKKDLEKNPNPTLSYRMYDGIYRK